MYDIPRDVFDRALEEADALDTDLHDIGEDYVSSYNVDILRKVIKIGKLQAEALSICNSRRAKPRYLEILNEIKVLTSEIEDFYDPKNK